MNTYSKAGGSGSSSRKELLPEVVEAPECVGEALRRAPSVSGKDLDVRQRQGGAIAIGTNAIGFGIDGSESD